MDNQATLSLLALPQSLKIRIKNSLRCQICSLEFADTASLRDHMVTELGIIPELVSFLDFELGMRLDSDELTPLTDCSSTLLSENRCDKCGKMCKTPRGLHQHYAKAHSRKKRHSVCKLCGKAFQHKYTLRFHVKQVHDQTTRVA